MTSHPIGNSTDYINLCKDIVGGNEDQFVPLHNVLNELVDKYQNNTEMHSTLHLVPCTSVHQIDRLAMVTYMPVGEAPDANGFYITFMRASELNWAQMAASTKCLIWTQKRNA